MRSHVNVRFLRLPPASSTTSRWREWVRRPAYNQGDREVHGAASFVTKDLLASGWVSGERQVHGKQALVEARYGKGRVVLFGFRPQFRGQSYGAFKFLLNAIYLGSAQPLRD